MFGQNVCAAIGRAVLAAAIAGLVSGCATTDESPVKATDLAITLKPHADPDHSETIDTVAVTLRFSALETGDMLEPVLAMPLVVSNVDTVATTLTDMEASDAQGPLTLRVSDINAPLEAAGDAESGGPSRAWLADRPIVGPVTVSFTVPAEATLPPRGPAPPFSFSADGGGVSASGHVFLPLPPGDATYRASFDWDLSALPAGARGVTTFGEGHVIAPERLTASELRMTFYMAGQIGVYPKVVPTRGFFGAWQGEPAFDAAKLLAWTSNLYGHYSEFFGQETPPPYGVFLRYNPINAGGGVGLYHSFVTTFGAGDGADVDKIRITLAHEMFHTFQPYIESPPGLESSWFGEGLAVFYARRLALRFDAITPDGFLDDLNSGAGRYYTSLMATEPNSEVPKRFWSDTRIRTLPYDRGMLYFATVDDAVRKASNGARSLDDLMLAMLALEQRGKVTTNADWEELLSDELGPDAVTAFRGFLDGDMPIPASDAFGPCFERTTRPMRRYELGFDTAVLAEPKRIVRGLVAGSAAEQAGLRNGDEIVVPVPQDGIQGNQTEMLKLKIRRNGEISDITYLPRGETVEAYQWQRRDGTEDMDCAL
tara:strand:- start:4006 stop:5796 length:1791 start_codon:yes stop_codon:yes gene_type:complete